MALSYQQYSEKLDRILDRLRGKYLGQEARFSALLPGGACGDQAQYAHRVAQVLMLQVARALPLGDGDLCRGYRWLHAAALFLIRACPVEDHTIYNLIRLVKLDRETRELLDLAHYPKHCVSAFLDAPRFMVSGLELAAWRMAEPGEERLRELEELG